MAEVVSAEPAFSNETVDAAMRYALEGGKGFRAFLVMEGARVHGVDANGSAHAAAAIECLHTYSLIHDDLPCMDDDDLRRGRPTVHRKWDEATAVLAGDALQSVAFELIFSSHTGDSARVALGQSLAIAAKQMVEGQALDIAAETAQRALTLAEIETLQALKTGALIRWSAKAGALIADADPQALDRYGTAIGTAFQIADDLLDVEGDESAIGKKVGKDADAGKATFVSHLGVEGAKARAAILVEEAIEALSSYGEGADALREAARFVIARDR
ncbi:MAG: polyprenyl synthetase family protein [Pseudomonadota bacterium]